MTDTIFQPGEYVTRDGRRVGIIRTDAGPSRDNLLGWIQAHDGVIGASVWYRNGCASDVESPIDLMPPKQVRYCNVYGDTSRFHHYATRELADKYQTSHRIACVRIEFTEGQYDE